MPSCGLCPCGAARHHPVAASGSPAALPSRRASARHLPGGIMPRRDDRAKARAEKLQNALSRLPEARADGPDAVFDLLSEIERLGGQLWSLGTTYEFDEKSQRVKQ